MNTPQDRIALIATIVNAAAAAVGIDDQAAAKLLGIVAEAAEHAKAELTDQYGNYYNVTLSKIGSKAVQVIKIVREYGNPTGEKLALKDAHALVMGVRGYRDRIIGQGDLDPIEESGPPAVMYGLTRQQATKFVQALREYGATAEATKS